MSLVISDDLLRAAHLQADELSREIAVMLFQQDRISLGKARKLAGMSHLDFQALLASRNIPLHYAEAEFEEDVATLRRLGRL